MKATSSSPARPRVYPRLAYIALAMGTIALGLIVHLHGDALGPSMRDATGDTLWAMMITWWVAAIVPEGSLATRSAAALAICFAVESSQLYHTAALDTLRGSAVGHLILGSDFDPRDLVAYAIGVLAALAAESLARFLVLLRSRP